MANKHVSHVKSTQIANKAFGEQQYPSISAKMGKRPSVSDLVDGEIAVNYAAGHETITIRNREIDSEGRVVENGAQNIVGFLNENVTYENELIAAQAIGQLKTEKASKVDLAKTDADVSALAAKTDADVSALAAKTDADVSALAAKTDADFSDRDEIRENNEDVIAAALSSIVGKTYSYLPEIESDSEYDTLNLIELHKRIKVLEGLVTALSEKVDELEQRLPSGGEG